MNKILVTGGFGFIGTTLVEQLVKRKKNNVHIIDDLSTSSIQIDDYLNQLGNPNNLSYEIITVESFFKRNPNNNYNEIYHLASPVGPAGVLKHAGNMVKDVVRDGYLIMDYCLKNGSKFLDISTSEIYGGGKSGYCPETTDKIVPSQTTVRLEYAVAKLAVETALINKCRVENLQATIVRPFNVAGPRQSPEGGFVVPRFIQQACSNKPITVFGDGSAIRAFTHVEDMASGIILAMERGKNGDAYNIGNPENKTTIINLAKKILSVINSESDIVFVDPKKIYGDYYEEANDKYPDAKKAKKELGWEPKFDIEKTVIDARDEYLRQKEKGILQDKI